MQHLEEGEIHAWLDGALSEAEGVRIEQHAASCKECAAMVADARGLIAGAARIVSALDHVPSGVIPKSGAAATASRPLWKVLRLSPFRAAMAASLIVAAGSLIVVQRKDSVLMAPRLDSVALPMTASAPAPAAPVVADFSSSRAAEKPATNNEARQLEQQLAPPPQQRLQESKTTIALSDTALLMKAAAPGATPAPKAAVAEDQRAKKERDSVVSANAVVTAAPTSAVAGGARGGGARASVGETVAREQSRDSTRARADLAFRRALPAAVQRADLADSVGVVNFIGCYEVAEAARMPGPLPSHFALTSDTAGARTQLLARSLNSAGRADSTPIGSWQRLTPTSIVVSFVTVAFPGPSYTLVRDASGITATSSRPGSASVRVTQRDCPR